MDFDLPAGRYVVAVSGGVDSIALLHMLVRRPEVRLTVAHYDHGIRADSIIDRKLVQLTAKEYDLPFVYAIGRLGLRTSEARARAARYDFLRKVQQASGARAIITAHHQDDVLETAILNILRGTGRRGLSSLKSLDGIKRPLLHVPKKELLRYARSAGLDWREDSTNRETRYLRNHIRHNLLPRFADMDREALLGIIARAAEQNTRLAEQLTNYLHVQPGTHRLNRHDFIALPHIVARDVMAEWLLLRTGAELNRLMLERLVIAAKTGRSGSRADIDKHYWLKIGRDDLALTVRER